MHTFEGHLAVGDPKAPVRVVLFPYAGATPLSLLPVTRHLPNGCSVLLPGSAGTQRTTPPTVYVEAVKALLPVVEAWADRPTVLYGHSLGALITHSLLSLMSTVPLRRIREVVLSGPPSPSRAAALATHPEQPFTTRSLTSLEHELRSGGRLPEETTRHSVAVAEAVTLLGLDLHLFDTYVRPERRSGSTARHHLWFGLDDPLSQDEAGSWTSELPSPPMIRSFPGTHFFPLEGEDVSRELGRLTRHLSSGVEQAT